MTLARYGFTTLGAFGAVGLMGVASAAFSPNAHAASMITGTTPAAPDAAVSPAAYDVFLEEGDPLSVTVDVTVPISPAKLDLFLLQDLSGSFFDDLPVLQGLVPSLVSGVTGTVADTQFGVGSFVDKPISPLGSAGSGDFVYNTDLAMTDDETALQAAIDGLSIFNGGDLPESQLSALLQTALRATSEIGFRSDAFKVAVLSTDAAFHQAGDFAGVGPNNGDDVLDGTPPGTGEDYPSTDQVKDALAASNIIPIFAATNDVIGTYEALVDEWGFGFVVALSDDSSDLVEAITFGLDEVFRDINLVAEGDDFGYVQSITPGSYADVPEGDTRTFSVELLADGVDDTDDSLSLVAAGFGETTVNVDVAEDDDGSASVPEPAATAGLAVLGLLGLARSRQRREQTA